MLHRNADHAINLKPVCTRDAQQSTGQEDGCEEGGAITICGCAVSEAGIHRLSKHHTIACAKRTLDANRRAGRIASIDNASKDQRVGRIDQKTATLRWRRLTEARCGQLLII